MHAHIIPVVKNEIENNNPRFHYSVACSIDRSINSVSFFSRCTSWKAAVNYVKNNSPVKQNVTSGLLVKSETLNWRSRTVACVLRWIRSFADVHTPSSLRCFLFPFTGAFWINLGSKNTGRKKLRGRKRRNSRADK